MRKKGKSTQFKPLPDNEKEICRRVAAIRRFKGLNQTELARRVGLTRDQLANIEAMRVALKFGTALAICRAIDINPNWLYSDADPQSPMLEFDDPLWLMVLDVLPSSDLFSSAWAGFGDNLLGLSTQRARRVSPKETVIPARAGLGGKKESKGVLDIRLGMADKEGVKTKIRSLPDLMNRLRELTKPRGQKAALARKMNVSRQAVDQWLSRSANPSAETTLELVNWVNELQGKQK